MTLARAIYSPAKIILLDDVLVALDVHTYVHTYSMVYHDAKTPSYSSASIVDKCFRGDLLKGRTVLLVVSIWKPERLVYKC